MYQFIIQLSISFLFSGDAGYVSDSDVCRRRGNLDSGYISEGGADYFLRAGRTKPEDGYASEGGAEFYSKKAEQRMAYERQRKEAEEQHKRYLQLSGKAGTPSAARQGHQPLPQVLGRQGGPSPSPPGPYKVVGGRRNVQKADSGAFRT